MQGKIRNTFSLFIFFQLILPVVIIVVFQQLFSIDPQVILGHLLVIFFLNFVIAGFGVFLFSRQFTKKQRVEKYFIAGLFGVFNVLLYFAYLFAFIGEHFNSKIFTLQIVLGYLRYLDGFIANLSLSPVLVYGILFFIPALLFIGTLFLRNSVQYTVLNLKKVFQKHHFNNPSRIIKINIVAFLLLVGFFSGVTFLKRSEIPLRLYKMEEPFVTVYFKNDPFDGKELASNNEDVGIRKSYPKDIEFDRKNVVVIVVDALRSDHLSLFGYERETSPFLDSLYASGNLRKVDMSFSVAAESFEGINAILRSKIWANLGYNNFSLQHLLKDQGYDLNFIVSGDHANFSGLKSSYGKDSDFSYYLDGSVTQKYSDPNNDRIILEGLENIPKYTETPAYLHFHLMSVHNLGLRLNEFKKYQPAGRTAFDAENYINRYDNGVLQADDFIKKIFTALSEKGYLQNSIVVITGDHGEALGDRGEFGHSRSVYTDQLLTPILIYDTESVEYKNTSYATLVDIAPTIVDRLGLPIPETWEGVSLFSEEFNRQLTFHQQQSERFAIIHSKEDKRYKLIYDSKTGKQELYELNSDLYETNNLIDSLDLEYVNTLRWYMSEFDLDPQELYEY